MVGLRNTITTCIRCGDELEFQDRFDADDSLVKLSIKEMSFIKTKFSGPLCMACLNQLKTSYRILHGDFNGSGTLVQ